jgi:hypothetical protein
MTFFALRHHGALHDFNQLGIFFVEVAAFSLIRRAKGA